MQRPITCLEIPLKLIEHVLKIRIENSLTSKNYFHYEQGGFCTGRGTYELFYILRCTIEEETKRNGKIYIAFLVLQKAFDKVSHELLLWKYKNDVELDDGIWLMLSNILGNFNVKTKWGRLLTDWFKINVGVFQGAVLSPLHFKTYVNSLISRIKSVGSGIEVANVLKIMLLVFADDFVIIDSDKNKFQEKLDEATNWALSHFSRWSVSKCVILSNDRDNNSFSLQGDEVCRGKIEKWLGLFFDDSGLSDSTCINTIKTNSQTSLKQIKIAFSKGLSPHRIIQTLIVSKHVSKLTYGTIIFKHNNTLIDLLEKSILDACFASIGQTRKQCSLLCTHVETCTLFCFLVFILLEIFLTN